MHFGLLFFFCSTPDANTLVRRRCSTQSGYQPSGKQHSCTHTHIKTTYIIEGYHWIWFLFCLSVAFAGEFHTRGVSLAQQSIESVSTARTYIKKNLLNQHVHRVVAFVWTEMRWINRRKKKKKHRMQWPMRMRNKLLFFWACYQSVGYWINHWKNIPRYDVDGSLGISFWFLSHISNEFAECCVGSRLIYAQNACCQSNMRPFKLPIKWLFFPFYFNY